MRFQTLFNETNLGIDQLKSIFEKLILKFKVPTMILFEGQAGVGKTESVRLICQILNFQQIASPSFAIIHQYQNQSLTLFTHVDLYRLTNDDDLESSGFWDLFANENQIIAIEWSEKINKDFLPLNWQKIIVRLEAGADVQLRNITITEELDY